MGYRKLIVAAITVVMGVALSTGTAVAGKGMFSLGPGDMASGQKIYHEGKGNAPPCVTCHMPDGSGDDGTMAPRVGGQFYTFLYKQLSDFASGERVATGAGAAMGVFASALSEQDMIDVSTYMANRIPTDPVLFTEEYLEELAENGVEVGEPYRGRQIVEFGSPRRDDGYPRDLGSQGPGLPACKSCHGVAGRGAPPVYPMIGQQRYPYLVKQLRELRDGTRNNDKMGQMQAVAQRMSDQDILDAAAYLSVANPYFTAGISDTVYDYRIKEANKRMEALRTGR